MFLDALASLDFKLSLSQRFTFFTASASTGLSDLFISVVFYDSTLDSKQHQTVLRLSPCHLRDKDDFYLETEL